MTKRYKEGTLALVTYASLTWAGVSLLAWFPSGGFEGTFGLALLLVGFLKGLLQAGEEGFYHPSFRSSGVFFRNGRILLREPSAWLSPEEARALAASLLVAAKVLEGD